MTKERARPERRPDADTPADTSSGTEECAALPVSIAHLYRAEMQRMTVWRQRLDTTTQWAIILTTGITTFVLGSSAVPHYAMLLALAFNTLFMVLEGRRCQHLYHSKWRLRLLERNYFAAMLPPGRPVDAEWQSLLSADLQQPHFTMTFGMGVRMRLRRNYLMLAYLTTAVWGTKVFIHPHSPAGWTDFYARLAVGNLLPSWLVGASALLFVLAVTVASIVTPNQEALEHWTTLELARRGGRAE